MKTIVSILYLSLISVMAYAQTAQVHGLVVDEKAEPMAGVAVLVAGSQTATMTDAAGKYAIKAGKKDVLVFSFLGYEELRENVSGRKQIDVVLKPSAMTLDDAVVIGYGTQKKSDLTGSVAVVSADDINSPALVSVDEALQGRIAGVDIVSSGGEPGAGTSIRVRGTRSITAGNDPLIVVDGVVGAVDDFSDINPEDIKSISVLKDASSTAIFGARGANGVILVTTKGGENKKMQILFRASVGLSELPKKLDVMDATEFAKWRNAYSYPNVPFQDPESLGAGTDWQDILTQKALRQSYAIRLTQGDRHQSSYVSFSYDNVPGIVVASGMKRASALVKYDRNLFKWMKAGVRLNYTWKHNDLNKIQINGNKTTAAVCLSPLVKKDDIWNRYSDSAESSSAVFNSPWLQAQYDTNYRNTNSLNMNAWTEIKPLKSLVLRASYSLGLNYADTWYYSPSTLAVTASQNKGGTAKLTDTNKSQHQSEVTLSWKKNIKRAHHIDLLGGFTTEYIRWDNRNVSGTGYADDNVGPNNMAGIIDKRNLTATSSINEITRLSCVARANYSYKSRYYATLTARYDGPSNFSTDNKWAFFPAAALKWTISNERWMTKAKYSGLTNLALRLSAGVSGNDALSAYVSQPSLDFSTAQWLFGDNLLMMAAPSRLGDPTLTWEKTTSLNTGLDVSLFKDRITMTFDAYCSFTDDLLLSVQNAKHTGYATRYANIGSTRGWGVEFSVDSRNIVRRHFSWRTTFTISHASSVVTDIGADYEYVPTYSRGTQMLFGYKKGYPVNALWGYQYCGVWQNQEQIDENKLTRSFVSNSVQLGHPKFADVNHDGVLDQRDNMYQGSSDPVVHGGLQNTFNIWNFQLGLFFTYSLGGKIYNISEFLLGSGVVSSNKYRYLYKGAWHAENNPNGVLPSVHATSDTASHSRYIHDSSFLRLKTLSFSYRFALSKKVRWLRDISLSLNVDNLFLLTGYNGFDPDVSASKSVQRLDNASYPRPRTYMFSVNVRY